MCNLIVVFGVSGCGKTTVARRLASNYGLKFIEADEFHSRENVIHMKAGRPLTEEMRAPWINDICNYLEEELAAGKSCVMANSCLRPAYREQFRGLGYAIKFVYLEGSYDVIHTRMNSREGHFMPVSLLRSQFATLEILTSEDDIMRVDANASEEVVFDATLAIVGEFLTASS